MLERLLDQKSWDEFLKAKLDNEYASSFLIRSLRKILKKGDYKKICDELVNGSYAFSIPRRLAA